MMRILSLCALFGAALLVGGGCAAGKKANYAPRAADGGDAGGGGHAKLAAPVADGKALAPKAAKAADKAAPPEKAGKGQGAPPQPGLLTAGSFDDNLFPEPFRK